MKVTQSSNLKSNPPTESITYEEQDSATEKLDDKKTKKQKVGGKRFKKMNLKLIKNVLNNKFIQKIIIILVLLFLRFFDFRFG